MKVHFEKVGRDLRCWDAELEELTYSELYREIKKRKALASREIDFAVDEDGQGGLIGAGGHRAGEFWVVPA